MFKISSTSHNNSYKKFIHIIITSKLINIFNHFDKQITLQQQFKNISNHSLKISLNNNYINFQKNSINILHKN